MGSEDQKGGQERLRVPPGVERSPGGGGRSCLRGTWKLWTEQDRVRQNPLSPFQASMGHSVPRGLAQQTVPPPGVFCPAQVQSQVPVALWGTLPPTNTHTHSPAAAAAASNCYLDLVQTPFHLQSLDPHGHTGLAVGQVPALLGLALGPEAPKVLVIGHLDTLAAQDWPRPWGLSGRGCLLHGGRPGAQVPVGLSRGSSREALTTSTLQQMLTPPSRPGTCKTGLGTRESAARLGARVGQCGVPPGRWSNRGRRGAGWLTPSRGGAQAATRQALDLGGPPAKTRSQLSSREPAELGGCGWGAGTQVTATPDGPGAELTPAGRAQLSPRARDARGAPRASGGAGWGAHLCPPLPGGRGARRESRRLGDRRCPGRPGPRGGSGEEQWVPRPAPLRPARPPPRPPARPPSLPARLRGSRTPRARLGVFQAAEATAAPARSPAPPRPTPPCQVLAPPPQCLEGPRLPLHPAGDRARQGRESGDPRRCR